MSSLMIATFPTQPEDESIGGKTFLLWCDCDCTGEAKTVRILICDPLLCGWLFYVDCILDLTTKFQDVKPSSCLETVPL